MSLTKRRRTWTRDPVHVLSMKWSNGALGVGAVAENFPCSFCGNKLGARRFATVWVDTPQGGQSYRACEDCGLLAEEDLRKASEQ